MSDSTLHGKVSLAEGMAFTASSGSGHTLTIDAAPSVGGKEKGPRPMELILLGLGGCTAMDVISILRKMRQGVTSYEVNLTGERVDEHPRVFTRIVVEHVVRGPNIDEDAVRKAIRLSNDKYCPASAMLSQSVDVEHRFRIIQD